MPPLAAAYLFLLGLASGVSLLTLTAYRRVSPVWLRWLLVLSGAFVTARYVTMALFTSPDAPDRFWALRPCWYATSIGLTLPGVFAIDQLLRHPAISPKRLLIWFMPFALAYGAVIFFGQASPEPDRVIGWVPRLSLGWQRWLAVVHAVFVLGFLGICALFMRKVPSRRIRTALLALAAGCLALGVDGLILALGGWYFRPYLYTEILMLLALWYAYDTSASS